MATNAMPSIQSEAIEPAFAHIIGVQFKRCELAKESDKPWALEDACKNFWYSMDAMNKLIISVRCGAASDDNGGCHASIAVSNHMRHVADYIEQCIGYNPITGDKNGVKDNTWGWGK